MKATDTHYIYDIGLGVAAAVVARVALLEGVHKALGSDPAELERRKKRAARTAVFGAVVTLTIYHLFDKQLRAIEEGADPMQVFEEYVAETDQGV